MDATPSTSGIHKTLVVGRQVVRTPQGSLRVSGNVLLERSDSGNLQSFRPETISAGEGVSFIDERIPHLRPCNLFPEDETDGDNIFDPLHATVLAEDSGSEADETEDVEELLEISEAEEEDDEVDENPQSGLMNWFDDYSEFQGSREEFHESVGPKIAGTSPLELFTQIWDQPLMEFIVTETNRYAWENIAPRYETEGGLPVNSRMSQWAETSVSELYRLFSILILMGMCVRGRIDEYWSTGTLGIPGFRQIMQRDRFLILIRFMHFVNNNEICSRGAERKIAKIKPLLNYLNLKFKSVYSPRREVTIDESLLLWKGHLSWIQCIRSKAARFGIKSYELCEAVSGYVINLIIYTGKGTLPETPLFGFTSSTAKIVLELFKEYLGKGYTLFMDNFYNSITLARFLKQHKTDVVGTLNRRRVDCPQDIKALNDKRTTKGTVVSRHCGDVSVVAWKDVKLVTTVSTYHNANMIPGRRAGQDLLKPEVVHEYNKYMGGVDLKDQKLSMYLLERKRGLKWYIKVFRRLLNISILNCYIIYCSNIGQHKKLTHREFRYKLAEELCARYGENVMVRSQRQNIPTDRLDKSQDHFPEHKDVTEERTSKQVRFQRGRCVRCAAKKQKSLSNIHCSHCKVFLCVGQCWREFHSLENL